ncbi:MAG: lipase family protein, partial [Bacteroidota bacterium]
MSVAEFDSMRRAAKVPKSLVGVRYAVKVYEVLYHSTNHVGKNVRASGLYMVPQGPKADLPVMAYNHGTRLKKGRKPEISGEELICAFFASDGYAVAMPDYLGLGSGEGQHLYHHVETEARSNVDLLRACREINGEIGVEWGKHLFVSGYSQGGHAALATHKYIQERHAEEFPLTASAPMSGAYDMAGVQAEVMWAPYSDPGYLPYLLYSFQTAYQILPDTVSPYKAPYDELLPPLLNGEHKLEKVNAVIPEVPVE